MIFKSLNIKFDLIICLAVFISCNVFSQKQRTIKLPNDPVNVKKALAGNADSQAFVGKSYYFVILLNTFFAKVITFSHKSL